MLLLSGCTQTVLPKDVNSAPTLPLLPPEGKGKLVVTVTDDTPSSSVKNIVVTMDLQACTAGGCTTLEKSVQMDVLDTAGLSALLANAELPSGEYTGLKLANLAVQTTDAAGKTVSPALASTELDLSGKFTIQPDGTTFIKMDFPADSWYTDNPTETLTPKIDTTVVADAEISTEPIEVDGVTYMQVNIEQGKIEAQHESRMTETGTTESRTLPRSSEPVMEMHVKEAGDTVVTFTDSSGKISSFTQDQPDVKAALTELTAESGLSSEQLTKAMVLEHEESEKLAKQSTEKTEAALAELEEAAQKSAEAEQAQLSEDAKGTLNEMPGVWKDFVLTDAQKENLQQHYQEVLTAIEQKEDPSAALESFRTDVDQLGARNLKSDLLDRIDTVEEKRGQIVEAEKAAVVTPLVIDSVKDNLEEAKGLLEQANEKVSELVPGTELKGTEEKISLAGTYTDKWDDSIKTMESVGGVVNVDLVQNPAYTTPPQFSGSAGVKPELIGPPAELLITPEVIAQMKDSITQAQEAGRITPEEAAEMEKQTERISQIDLTVKSALSIVNTRLYEKASGQFASDYETAASHGYTGTKEQFMQDNEKFMAQTPVIPTFERAKEAYGFQGSQEEYEKAVAYQAIQTGTPVRDIAPGIYDQYSKFEGELGAPVSNGFYVPKYEEYQRQFEGTHSREDYEKYAGINMSGVKVAAEGYMPPPQYYVPPAGFAMYEDSSGQRRLAATYVEEGQQTEFTDPQGTTWARNEDGTWSGTKSDGSMEKFEPYKPAEGEGQYGYVPPVAADRQVSYYNPYTSFQYNYEPGTGHYSYMDDKGKEFEGSLGEGIPLALGSQGFVAPQNWKAEAGYTPPVQTFNDPTGQTWTMNPATGTWTNNQTQAVVTSAGSYIPGSSGEGHEFQMPAGYMPPPNATGYSANPDGTYSYTGGSYSEGSYAYDAHTGTYSYTGTGNYDAGASYNSGTGTYSGGGYYDPGTGGYSGGGGYSYGDGSGSGGYTGPPGGDGGGGMPPGGDGGGGYGGGGGGP
ncbi:MAG: hypothetical protein HY917_03240 [Candidatus Diapherotrites archaeon]|nr:hypothetical protein [Candidatus Diapherotrites archaeon]